MSAQKKKKREQPPALPSRIIYRIKYIIFFGKVKEWLERNWISGRDTCKSLYLYEMFGV